MRYPYIDYSDRVKICPIFEDLTGDPLVVDLGAGAPVYEKVDLKDQKAFQTDRKMLLVKKSMKN